MEYVHIGSLMIAVVIIGLLYWLKYYHDLNASLKTDRYRIPKITPFTFGMVLLLISLISVATYSLIRVNALENENGILMKELEFERFDDGDFPNGYFKKVYEEHNMYFSGFYLDDNGHYILCLTSDVPSDLTDYLTSGDVQFIKVPFSYAQLKEVFKIIGMNIQEYNFISVALNMRDNTVRVTIIDDSIDLSYIQSYIDEGIVTVRIGEEVVFVNE